MSCDKVNTVLNYLGLSFQQVEPNQTLMWGCCVRKYSFPRPAMVGIGPHKSAWVLTSLKSTMKMSFDDHFVCLVWTQVVQLHSWCLLIGLIPYLLISIISLTICLFGWDILSCYSVSSSPSFANVLIDCIDCFEVMQAKVFIFGQLRGGTIVETNNPLSLLFLILP